MDPGEGARLRRLGGDERAVEDAGLATVCQEAACPNIGECWEKKHATFMIMGDICTRACAFCNVATGLPAPLDPSEPGRVAKATAALGLSHVVVTSVDRDDLDDGGAEHFAQTIAAIRATCPDTTIEVLTPGFPAQEGRAGARRRGRPDVFNHNLETVPSLYVTVRPGARYFHSLRLLQRAKELNPSLFTKSGPDGRARRKPKRSDAGHGRSCARRTSTFLTIGQYLQPTRKHHAIARFVTPEEFDAYKTIAYAKGFSMSPRRR